jgi:hypothetical protein
MAGFDLYFTGTGNFLIGSSTDNGSKLQITGGLSSTADALIHTLTVGTGKGGDNSNVAVGFQSLLSNAGGSNNVAVGYNSLASNTVGIFNTAIGYSVLQSAADAEFNVAVGFNSMALNNTSGSKNVALGGASMYAATTAAYNIAIGFASLENITSGGFNTSIGAVNGSNNLTTGAFNTFIGAQIEHNSAIVTGSYNTLIGAQATVASDLSSTVLICDGSGGTRIYSPISKNILIGTTTDVASAKLIVSSTTQGFLPPLMTTTQKNAITSPAEGLVVYDLTLHTLYYYNGSAWTAV